MNNKTPQEITLEKIQILSSFKEDICQWLNRQYYSSDVDRLRSQIKQNTQNVRNIVEETYCLKLMPTNPHATGLIVRDCDPFNYVLENPYCGVSFIPAIVEIINDAIIVLQSSTYIAKLQKNKSRLM